MRSPSSPGSGEREAANETTAFRFTSKNGRGVSGGPRRDCREGLFSTAPKRFARLWRPRKHSFPSLDASKPENRQFSAVLAARMASRFGWNLIPGVPNSWGSSGRLAPPPAGENAKRYKSNADYFCHFFNPAPIHQHVPYRSHTHNGIAPQPRRRTSAARVGLCARAHT